MEYYINDFQQYIKQLCIQHVDVLHNDNTNVAFVHFQSNDGLNQVANQGANTIVIINRFYGKAIGETADDMDMQQFVQIRFAVAAIPDPVINYTDVITAALDKAFTIMMDFISKFRQDQYENDCGPLRGLNLPSCSWAEIPEQPFLLQHHGWDLTLPYKSAFPDYNADKWTGGA